MNSGIFVDKSFLSRNTFNAKSLKSWSKNIELVVMILSKIKSDILSFFSLSRISFYLHWFFWPIDWNLGLLWFVISNHIKMNRWKHSSWKLHQHLFWDHFKGFLWFVSIGLDSLYVKCMILSSHRMTVHWLNLVKKL